MKGGCNMVQRYVEPWYLLLWAAGAILLLLGT